MKKTIFFRITIMLLLFAIAVVPTSCGSDDSDPVEMTDTDSDGVIDSEDTCPNVAGLASLNGCPDTDSDGIADADDECPNEAGVAELNGCPDSDSDGIADADDECPNEAGVAELNGCPLPVDAEESTEVVGPSLLKINSGGEEVIIGDDTFVEDVYYSIPWANYVAHPSIVEIENTDLDDIYLTEMITSNDNNQGPISYNIPITNGIYSIKFHFAEIYWGLSKRDAEGQEGGVGSRVFDIAMEDTPILNNFDVIAVTGAPATAITKMYDIEVTDGELNIVFTSTVDKPKVSAIEIFGNGTIGD